MNDPYELLGVGKAATSDEVRIAYRRAAKVTHPDRDGGDAARMADVNEAYAVLADPERRKRFDETGDTSQPQPLEAEAISGLADILKQALDQDQMPVLVFARRAVAEIKAKLLQQQHVATARKDRLTGKRAKVRVTGQAVNLVHALVDAQVAALSRELEAVARMLQVSDVVETLLQSYEEDTPAELQQMIARGFGGFGTTSTAFG